MTEFMAYLSELLSWRLRQYLKNTDEPPPAPPTTFKYPDEPIVQFIQQSELTLAELVVFLLALSPRVLPGMIDAAVASFVAKGNEIPELGGIRGAQHRGIIPTCETALFILVGRDIEARMELMPLFSPDYYLFKERILRYDTPPDAKGDPPLSMPLILEEELAEFLLFGSLSKPKLSIQFPAQYITTALEWDDLVLPATTISQIKDIERWVNHHAALQNEWGMNRHLKPGYRVLFYGASGTGKTLTATLLGKFTNRDVFRVDLSLVVSKYIGETEKNLAQLFDKAHAKNWILFFDEADALFGKRTETRDAHDRYANQEVAYLLQKIEEFDGLVILASNLKSNIDPAFSRRFQAMIHFPIPTAAERLRLWEKSIPKNARLESDDILIRLAQQYELTGAGILNVVQFAALRALSHNSNILPTDDLIEGIRLEYQKEGRILA